MNKQIDIKIFDNKIEITLIRFGFRNRAKLFLLALGGKTITFTGEVNEIKSKTL